MDVIDEDVTLRPRDVVERVKQKVPMTEREKKSLHQFVSRCVSMKCPTSSHTLRDFVVPDALKVIIDAHGDVGDYNFLIHDTQSIEPTSDRILIFASHSMRQRAAVAKELYADGTYRTVSNVFATLYSIHTEIDGISYPIFFILMPNEQTQSFIRAFNAVKQYTRAFDERCVVHVDCQLAAINAFEEVFGCGVKICLFHMNQSVWKAVSRFGLAGAYNSISYPRLHTWVRRLLSFPFLPPDVITNEFERLFETEALAGQFCVEDQFIERFRELVAYFRNFWMTKIPVVMWSQHTSTARTNNKCEGFHSSLRQVSGIVHPNPCITIQLLRRVDKEATGRFDRYFEGGVAKRASKRSFQLEEQIRNAVERYDRYNTVIEVKQFLDRISSAYLEYYYNEKMARRNISMHVISVSKKHMDDIVNLLDEQSKYDPLEETTCASDFIERDVETEILFDSMMDSQTLGGDTTKTAEEDATTALDDGANDACVCASEAPSVAEKRKRGKRAMVTKPRRQSGLMRGLEKAREKARAKDARKRRA